DQAVGGSRPARPRPAGPGQARRFRARRLARARLCRSRAAAAQRRQDVDAEDGSARRAGARPAAGGHRARDRHRQRLPDGAAREPDARCDEHRDRRGDGGRGAREALAARVRECSRARRRRRARLRRWDIRRDRAHRIHAPAAAAVHRAARAGRSRFRRRRRAADHDGAAHAARSAWSERCHRSVRNRRRAAAQRARAGALRLLIAARPFRPSSPMTRSPTVFAAALALALSFSHCEAAEDLMEIYREAQRNDPALAAARANWEATQERVPQARAGLLPNVSLSASANGNYFGTNVDTNPRVNVDRGFAAGGLTVSASQPLYRYANQVAYSQAVQQVEQADYTLALARQDLILRVAIAYFDVLLAEFNVDVTDSQKAAVSEQLAQAKRNFEVGVATITDTNEAQAKYDSIRDQGDLRT